MIVEPLLAKVRLTPHAEFSGYGREPISDAAHRAVATRHMCVHGHGSVGQLHTEGHGVMHSVGWTRGAAWGAWRRPGARPPPAKGGKVGVARPGLVGPLLWRPGTPPFTMSVRQAWPQRNRHPDISYPGVGDRVARAGVVSSPMPFPRAW